MSDLQTSQKTFYLMTFVYCTRNSTQNPRKHQDAVETNQVTHMTLDLRLGVKE